MGLINPRISCSKLLSFDAEWKEVPLPVANGGQKTGDLEYPEERSDKQRLSARVRGPTCGSSWLTGRGIFTLSALSSRRDQRIQNGLDASDASVHRATPMSFKTLSLSCLSSVRERAACRHRAKVCFTWLQCPRRERTVTRFSLAHGFSPCSGENLFSFWAQDCAARHCSFSDLQHTRIGQRRVA